MNRPQTPPVSEGQEVDVRIESVGDKGDGVAKVKGFVIFIPNVKAGDWCKIRIKKVSTSVAFGEKIKEIEPQETPKESYSPKPKDEFDDIDLENLGEGSENFGEE